MKNFITFLLGLAVSLCLHGVVLAQSDSVVTPLLKKAIDAWLDYDDKTALPLLSKLAKSGNENAMLLLGQINIRPTDISPYLKSLDIKTRNSLIRAPGGLSGKSWFSQVKKNKELADAFVDAGFSPTLRKAIGQLLKYQEYGQAITRLQTAFNQGRFQTLFADYSHYDIPLKYQFELFLMAGVSDRGKLDREARKYRKSLLRLLNKSIDESTIHGHIFLWLISPYLKNREKYEQQIKTGSVLMTGNFIYDFENSIELLLWSYKKNPNKQKLKQKLRREWKHASEAALKLILDAKEFEPIINFCNKHCPDSNLECVKFTFSRNSGYNGYIDIQSPLEKLISQRDFFKAEDLKQSS